MTNHWSVPSGLDRAAIARSEADVHASWATAVVLEVDSDGNVAARNGRPLPLTQPGLRRPEDILLGWFQGRPWFARPATLLDGETLGWRDVDPADYDPLAAAVALTRWHLQAPACERCGSPTRPDQAGARRVCDGCGALAFPRIDPCVIVAITDPQDRLLLARQQQWQARRVSIVAGFIEAGESAEQACHREAGEEVGVVLERLEYISSQPWPMPRSLMLGFNGRAADSRIRVDGDEIVEGAYYTRADLAAAVGSGDLTLPGRASIARHLIERWLATG